MSAEEQKLENAYSETHSSVPPGTDRQKELKKRESKMEELFFFLCFLFFFVGCKFGLV